MTGPFGGYRLGQLDAPVRIHALSVGGCFVECHGEVLVGRRVRLQIDLPGEGWITVDGDALYAHQNCGFALKFVDVDPPNRGRIERTIARILDHSEDEWRVDGV